MERTKARWHRGAKRRHGAWRTIGAGLGAIATLIAAVVVVAWLTGRIASDRFLWSQWLLWIPTPVALIASVLGIVGSFRPAKRNRIRKRRSLMWACVAIAIGVHFAFIEHRLFQPAAANPGGLRLVHWNMTHLQYGNNDVHVRQVIAMDGDVTILTNAGPARYDRQYVTWLADSYQALTLGPFTVLSRLPITSSTMLAEEQLINLGLITVEFEHDRELSLLLVDLPSEKSIRRSQVADVVLRLLEAANTPPVDVAVGDFNMTRGSASLRRMFPGMHHAYDEAGSGLGASFPRRRPIVHIDHVLLADTVHATSYELVNPAVSRHRVQVVHLRKPVE